MGTMYVNRSGRSWTVTRTNGGSDAIATIRPNDVFAWTHGWNGNHTGADYQGVYYKGLRGWTAGMTGTGAFTPISDCGLYRANIEGKNCAVFQLRRAAPYYDTNGTLKGTMPTGSYLGTQNGAAGSTKPGLMYADYWGPYDPSYHDVFVAVGIDANNDPAFNNINLIGKLN